MTRDAVAKYRNEHELNFATAGKEIFSLLMQWTKCSVHRTNEVLSLETEAGSPVQRLTILLLLLLLLLLLQGTLLLPGPPGVARRWWPARRRREDRRRRRRRRRRDPGRLPQHWQEAGVGGHRGAGPEEKVMMGANLISHKICQKIKKSGDNLYYLWNCSTRQSTNWNSIRPSTRWFYF